MAGEQKIRFTEEHFGKLLDIVILAQEQESLEPLKAFNGYDGVPRELYDYALKTQRYVMKLKGIGEDKAVLLADDKKTADAVAAMGAGRSKETGAKGPGRIPYRR